MRFQFLGEPGLFPAQLARCLGDSHPLTGACPDQVCLEFGHHGHDFEEQPAGSVGSRTEPPMPSLTSRRVRPSTMSMASRSDLASRSVLATTGVSPSRQAASACPSPGRGLLVPVGPWSVKSRRWHTQGKQGVLPGGGGSWSLVDARVIR
jgi:hypothetical protein